jgi:hypothetical protein
MFVLSVNIYIYIYFHLIFNRRANYTQKKKWFSNLSDIIKEYVIGYLEFLKFYTFKIELSGP